MGWEQGHTANKLVLIQNTNPNLAVMFRSYYLFSPVSTLKQYFTCFAEESYMIMVIYTCPTKECNWFAAFSNMWA
ncbi:MAG TPA: hypothetical protein DIS90_05380 [Cytophagales bacterium]|nr:hypothetical protein [Cytophagales bacterium]